MSKAIFRPLLKITIYLTVIQYLTCFLFLLAFFTIVGSNKSYLYNYLLLFILFLTIVTGVARETHREGLVRFSFQGLSGCSFGQLGKSNHYLSWNEIYAVEPYRYFGLPFLLIRHHSSEYPVWLPLFLQHQTQLNLSILEQTSPNNPLHIALLNKHELKQISWHSRIKPQKSDLYIQKQKFKDASRFYYSFKHLFWFYLSIEILVFLAVWLCFRDTYQYSITEILIVLLFFLIMIVIMWLCFRNSYVTVNKDTLEININLINYCQNHHIKWSEISRVKYVNSIIFKQFLVFNPHGLYGFNYTVINISLIDKAKFKQAIITHTKPENPLHQAVVKYL